MKEKKHSSFAGIMEFANECKKTMVLSVILAIISVLCGLSPYFAVSGIIVDFINEDAGVVRVLFWLAIFLAGAALKSVLYGKSTMLSHRAAFSILKNIRRRIAEKLLKVPMGFLQEQPSGKLKMLIVDEVEKLEYPLAHAIPELTSNIVAPVAIFVFLLLVDVRMAFISLITLPLGFLITGVMMAGYRKRYSDWSAAGESMNNTIVEYINGIEVIKAFNQTTSSFEKYRNAVIGYRDCTLAWYKANWPFNAAYAAVLPAVLVATLPFGVVFYMEGSIALPSLILTLILSLGLIPPIMKLIEFTDNLTVIAQTETKVRDMLSAGEMSFPTEYVPPENLDLRLSNVSFTYDERPVLKNISLEMKEKTTTALVGASGSGKSTITRLIARFWDVNEGKITIGGRCVKDFPQEQLSALISYVSQNIYLFDMSIKENIGVGNPSATDEQIKEAAALAGCDDFISRFPGGYKTMVGDAGDRLSGGEKQRIAIARAILKDAPIVLLDEATASIDAENEYRIQQSIGSLTRNKTLIIVAHRLSTIVNADNIVVIDNGQIRAQGRHGELLESSELYRSMWEAHMDAGKWSIGTTKAGYKNV